MAIARAYQEALARDGCGLPPMAGSRAAADALGLHRELRAASRVRFFLHGHHDLLNPESDRITLVDAEQPEARIDLKAYELRRLPLSGVESLELWACEGAAHGRTLAEHGVSEEPEDLMTSFLLAGARRVVASRWHVPTLPSALLMERFGLLLEQGMTESFALSKARSDCREAFAPAGLVEREMRAQAEPLLVALAADGGAIQDEQVLASLAPAFDAALRVLRVGWREHLGGGSPGPTPNLAQAMGRLARYSAPRPERLGAGLRADAPAWVAQLVTEHLRPYRSPICWAGWRLVIRSLADWRP
jgi:CHAT domain-containing protein